MNKSKNIIDNLDFSGGPNSWFELWHKHIDMDGAGNNSWETRKQNLDVLFLLYRQLSNSLESYPHPFQLWIEIDETDSKGDSVYIHSPNPNGTEFPVHYDQEGLPPFQNAYIEKFLQEHIFTIKGLKSKDGNLYFLYKSGVGIPL